MKKSTLFTLVVPALISLLAVLPYEKEKALFHTDAELAYFREKGTKIVAHDPDQLLPIDSNILFPTARSCGGCHGFDPNGFALVTTSGEDVNIYDDWRSTMMANSAKDPFWRAKVTHEILVNPAHSLELQDKCTSCHAPAGHYQAKLKRGQAHYTLYEMYTDSLGLDGVTCQICHAQPEKNLGQLHSGELYFDTNYIRVAYGPYEFPFAPPMHNFVGITPKFGYHILDAGICAGCHTLITGTADLDGNPTGATFVEQATYHEWLNSRYADDRDDITCQSCHMRQLLDEIIISANYLNLTPRFPFGLHEMAGANVTMLKLLRDNRTQLEIDALPEHFDSTIAATLRMLQKETLDLSLEPEVWQGDTAIFRVSLHNKAGHKFPSGYPSRRAWVEFEVKDQAGQTVFHSGRMAGDYTLPDEDADFEPHHQVISREDQVQIYEMVPVDVSGQFTTVLERAEKAVKDNRLAPEGFREDHPVYDTTRIAGQALADPDFNRGADGMEGSGTDWVYYQVPIDGYEGYFTVTVRVWYQSLPPRWMEPMFEYSSPEIDSFRAMYQAADLSPVLVASRTLDSLFVTPVRTKSVAAKSVSVHPVFSPDGVVRVFVPAGDRLDRVLIWDLQGRLHGEQRDVLVNLPVSSGVYLVEVRTRSGRKVFRVIR